MTATTTKQQEEMYLYGIVYPLVENKDAVTIEYIVDERGVLLFLTVAKEDMGRVIGKQGDTIRAIRRLVRQLGMANDKHIAIKINDLYGTGSESETKVAESIA
jgi:hypothetical protein